MLLAWVNPKVESLLLPVLIQLVVIIVASRIMAAVFRRLRQPTVVGEIAAGLLLGPSCFGGLAPDLSRRIFDPEVNGIFDILSQLGLIFLLFLIGLEFDFGHLKGRGKAALSISLSGILLPLALGIGLAFGTYHLLERGDDGQPVQFLGYVLFMGIAMSITAVPVLGRMMLELGITRTRIGAITISAAAIDDACGWILLAAISGIVQSRYDPALTIRMVLMTFGFLLFMLYLVRPLLTRFVRFALRRGKGEIGVNTFAAILVIILLCSIATNRIGIFAVFGAFLAGTILSSETEFREIFSRQFRSFVTVFFLPIFFTYTGLRTDIGTLTASHHVWMLAAVLACAVIGKLGGCGLAAWAGGFSRRESLLIGTMMNTRGLMELIVINVGLELGVITRGVYCMLVIMALVTTMMTTPLLIWFMSGTELEKPIQASGFLDASPSRRKKGTSHAVSRR